MAGWFSILFLLTFFTESSFSLCYSCHQITLFVIRLQLWLPNPVPWVSATWHGPSRYVWRTRGDLNNKVTLFTQEIIVGRKTSRRLLEWFWLHEVDIHYCRTGHFRWYDIFADWDLKVDALLYFLSNNWLHSYWRTWYFRGFLKIREICENVMSAKNPVLQYVNVWQKVALIQGLPKSRHDRPYPNYKS